MTQQKLCHMIELHIIFTQLTQCYVVYVTCL